MSESERTDSGRVEFAVQPEAQKVFSAIWELESQVNNGGFDQYFHNSDSDIIAYAPVALRAIGASSCAELVERAIQVIAPLPLTQNGRYEALDAAGDNGQDRLTRMDSEFFAYPDNLTELLFEFVRQHSDSFGPVPSILINYDPEDVQWRRAAYEQFTRDDSPENTVYDSHR